MADCEEVELGFVEECSDPDTLTSPYYPSKVGGKVAWLDPVHLPTPERLKCGKCSKPCVLLLQIYAPLSDSPETFHRSVFVFMCRDAKCHVTGSTEPFRVLRSNLPQENGYYVDSPHVAEECDERESDRESDDEESEQLPRFNPQMVLAPVCFVCGGWAPQKCGRCHKVHYCSREHQTSDWMSGHKKVCKELAAGNMTPSEVSYKPCHDILLREMEIITKPESKQLKTAKRTESERMADYHKLIGSEDYGKSQLVDVAPSTFTQAAKDLIVEDKIFEAFRKRVSLEPEQVIRFQPGGGPLLVYEGKSQVPIPPCSSCGSERRFEFQIMPQLLYYLKLNQSLSSAIDWATLLIYTCAGNCHASPGYYEEFLLKHDFEFRSTDLPI